MSTEPKPKSDSEKALDKKWGKKVMDCGYTAVPTVLIKYQQRLKLKPLDVNVLLHLLSYWWRSEDFPRPSKKSIALAVGVDPSTVRRCLKKLEAKGYLTRVERRTAAGSRPNTYNLTGLVNALQPLSIEELAEIQKRKQQRLAKLAGKKPLLQVVK
jgi:DNA-binding MarR family transcriptional regulator